LSLFYGVWEFTQTSFFIGQIKDKVSQEVKKQSGISVAFDNFQLHFFPPKTVLQNVAFGDSKNKWSATFSTVSISFSPLDIFSSELVFDEIAGEAGTISVGQIKRDEKKKKNDNLYQSLSLLLPPAISKIKIKDTTIDFAGKPYAEIDKLFLLRSNNLFIAEAFASDIQYGQHQISTLRGKWHISPKEIKIISMEVGKHESIVAISGGIFDGKLDLKLSIDIELAKILRDYDIDPALISSATIKGEISVIGKLSAPTFRGKISVENLICDYLRMQNIKLTFFSDKNQNIWIDKLHGIFADGSISLLAPIKVFSKDRGDIVFPELSFDLKNMQTDVALHFLRKSFSNVVGKFTGRVFLAPRPEGLEVVIEKGSAIDNFRLLKHGSTKNILENERIGFDETQFFIDKNKKITMKVGLEIAQKKVVGTGVVSSDGIEIRANCADMDMNKFGPIVGKKILGTGPISVVITRNKETTLFTFNLKMEGFKVIGLDLGKTLAEITYNSTTNQLRINQGMISRGNCRYTLDGIFDFSAESNYNLRAKFDRCSADNSRAIFKHYLSGRFPTTERIDFTHSSNLSIKGNLHQSKISVNGKTHISRASIWGERINGVDANISYSNEQLEVTALDLRKGSGRVSGKFSWNFNNGLVDYDLAIRKIKLRESDLYQLLNLGHDGELAGVMVGRGARDGLEHRLELEIYNSTIGTTRVNNSRIKISGTNKKVLIEGNLLGDSIKLNSLLFLRSSEIKEKSTLHLEVNENEIKNLFGLFSAHNAIGANIRGQLKGFLDASFDLENPASLNVNSNITDFNWGAGATQFSLIAPANLAIKEGVIQKWYLKLKNQTGKDFIINSGQGDFKNEFRIFFDYNYNAELFSILSPQIAFAAGKVEGMAVFIGKKGGGQYHASAKGRNIDIRLKNIPNDFSMVNFNVVFDDKKIIFDNFSAKYGNGNVSASGRADFSQDLFSPAVDLNLSLRQVQVPFMSNSSALVSGDFEANGKKRPYYVSGRVSVLFAELLEDFSEFYKLKIVNKTLDGILPTEREEDKQAFVDYKIDVNFMRGISFKNSYIDSRFSGEGVLKGEDADMRFVGNFAAIKETSKFKFKGHEFKVYDGNIFFSENKDKQAIEVKINSTGQIGNYKIALNVDGRPENLLLKMESNPPLSQNDILSLLALGVTTTASKNLEESDLSAVATLGLGNLLADQLQISKNIANPLGLQLTVSPELGEETDEQQLQNVSSSTDTASKIRSTTVVKIKMNLATNLDLSLSSTVGGATGQKQEMHIDYGINKNMSLQGVYESKSSADNTTETTNSAGFDLIYRKSFK